MPELPEVHQFRQFLLPLVSDCQPLTLELLSSSTPPKGWISQAEINVLGKECYCTDVLRKGKQLCMVLQTKTNKVVTTHYLFLHMGMTGRISSPGRPMGWGHEGVIIPPEEQLDESFPPKYAHLILQTNSYQAAFCDPRKFGKTELRTDCQPFDSLAEDAWQGSAEAIVERITHQSTGIKALLLDQKRACAGVGNWVADEVLYQCRMHPDQSYLTVQEATTLTTCLQSILGTAVDCLSNHVPYPAHWLFPYRWTKKKAGSKDGQGRPISFVTSGGRTSAMIASQQKLYKRKRAEVESGEEKNCHKKFKVAAKSIQGAVDKIAQATSSPTFTNKRARGRATNAIIKQASEAENQTDKESASLTSKRSSRTKKQSPVAMTTPLQMPTRRSPRFVSP